MRAVLAGGGTGGHVIPALAIAQQLKKDFGAEVLFIGTPRGMENRLVPPAGFELRLVQVGALNRVSLATRVKTLFDLPRAVWQSSRMLSEFRADVVVGVGGYASGPAMLAAVLRRLPTVAFEPNVVPGFANRAVARWVSTAAVQFVETGRFFKNFKVTGVPVRPAFFEITGRRTGDPRPTLLVFGGSQGARFFAEFMPKVVAELPRAVLKNLRLTQQCRPEDMEAVKAAYGSLNFKFDLRSFFMDMPLRIANAHLVICRSGASTIAELGVIGRPAIMVPLPHALDNDQLRNAESFAGAGAGWIKPQADLVPGEFAAFLTRLRYEEGELRAAAKAALDHGRPDAAQRLADLTARLAANSAKAKLEKTKS